jgi:hypothetical protein
VINITEALRTAGNNFVFGLIDWDGANENKSGIKVLGDKNRYSIENYILDPIFVSALLLREKIIKREELMLTNEESFTDFKNFSSAQLQHISDYFVNKIKPLVNPINDRIVSVSLMNGLQIDIPEWYLHHQGHSLEDKILKTFPQLGTLKRDKEEALKIEIIDKVIDDLPGLLSVDLLDAFKFLQSA